MVFFVVLLAIAVSHMAALPAPDLSYIRNGTCLNMHTQSSLNYEKFSGRWVEVASRPNLFRKARQCASVQFTVTEDGLERVTTAVHGQDKLSHVATLLIPQDKPATFSILYFGLPIGSLSVVDTDYTSMACVYHCQQATPTDKLEWGYVYARDLKDAAIAKRRCKKTFTSQGFDVQSIMPSPHPYETCNTASA